MQPKHPFSLPANPPRRETMLCVRLTEAERTTIQDFARENNISISGLVRYVVLQAIHAYTAEGTDAC